MKILLLILSSTGHEYKGFETLWRKYMHSHPDIDAYFYKGNPDLDDDAKLEGDVLWVKCPDTYDAVYEKLMRTFQYFHPQLDAYDLVFRTNMSSFLDFKKFRLHCERLPKTNCYAGVTSHDVDTNTGFVSGAGFAISPDLVKRLLQEQPPYVYLDDVTLGKAILSWGVPMIRANRVDVCGPSAYVYQHAVEPWEIIFHYRAKTDDRDKDAERLTQIAEVLGAF
jgi:hypothetical protein